MENLILEVKKKKEFSGIPNSLVGKVLARKEIVKKERGERVKLARAYLRKYFGVFLTNRVLKSDDEEILKFHISSKARDYDLLYSFLVEKIDSKIKSVIDLGCGVNGFSYDYLRKYFGGVEYVGVEALGQISEKQNNFFKKNKFNARVECADLTDTGYLKSLMGGAKSPRVIFLFQSIDAMEAIEPNFFKKLVELFNELISKSDFIIISNSLKTISGREKNFKEKKWVEYALGENFFVAERFKMFDEEFLIVRKN